MLENVSEATALNAFLIKHIERFWGANDKTKPTEATATKTIRIIHLERIRGKRSHKEYPSVKSVDYRAFDLIFWQSQGQARVSLYLELQKEYRRVEGRGVLRRVKPIATTDGLTYDFPPRSVER